MKSTLIRRTIRTSIRESVFAQIHASLAGPGSMFITKFAVLLGATPFQFGLLAAMGQISQIFQPLGAVITRGVTSRKRFVIRVAAVGRVLTFCYAALALAREPSAAMTVFLVVFLFSNILQAMSGNAWIAWISDVIPFRMRGRFFSGRARYMLLAGVVTSFFFSGFLDLFDPLRAGWMSRFPGLDMLSRVVSPEHIHIVFVVIFGTAALAGLWGLRVLSNQPELPKEIEPESAWEMFREPFRDRNFRRLLVYTCWWMLALGIGSPFWQPFMIQKLKMSLLEISVYGTIATVASLIVLRIWGGIIDRVGNKTTMRICILMSGMNALIWVFATPALTWILYVEAVTSGIMWAGAGIVAMNFVLSVAPEHRRQIYSGIYGAFSGAAMMVTMLLSGAFLPEPVSILGRHLEPEQVLFALTACLRWSALIPLLAVQEVHSSPMRLAFSYVFHQAKVRMVMLRGRIITQDRSVSMVDHPDIPDSD